MTMHQQATAWVVGNLATSPEPDGQGRSYRVRLRVLNNTGHRDRESGVWVEHEPNGTEVMCWGELARNVAGSLQKGDPVVALGRLEENLWRDKEGRGRRTSRLVAEVVAHDLSRGCSRFTKVSRGSSVVELTGGETGSAVVDSDEADGDHVDGEGVDGGGVDGGGVDDVGAHGEGVDSERGSGDGALPHDPWAGEPAADATVSSLFAGADETDRPREPQPAPF